MTVYHGATVVLRLCNILADGKILQEYLGTLNGSGAEQTFYTANFPITDNAGTATDAEANVDVYTRPATGGETFTELADDGTAFDIVGATGAVTIEEAANQAGDAGKFVSISYWTDAIVSRGQGASVDFSRDIQDIHELGAYAPAELAAGQYTISGTIDTFYTTRDMFGKILGAKDYYKVPEEFSFYIYPNGNAAGQPYIKLSNVKFSGGSLKTPLKAPIALGMAYKGLVASIGTV